MCLDGGKVVELGSYDELVRKDGGVFKDLVEHQLFEWTIFPLVSAVYIDRGIGCYILSFPSRPRVGCSP